MNSQGLNLRPLVKTGETLIISPTCLVVLPHEFILNQELFTQLYPNFIEGLSLFFTFNWFKYVEFLKFWILSLCFIINFLKFSFFSLFPLSRIILYLVVRNLMKKKKVKKYISFNYVAGIFDPVCIFYYQFFLIKIFLFFLFPLKVRNSIGCEKFDEKK